MRITVIGRGRVGGGLAALWRDAGHEVTTLGRDGGDATRADVLVVAVPGKEIADALGKIQRTEGKVALDVSNSYGGRGERFESNAHQVKSITGAPVAKAFNTNFAALYESVAAQRVRPTKMYAADEALRKLLSSSVAMQGTIRSVSAE